MKAKISVLIEIEYTMNPKHYEACGTAEEMLALDLSGAEEDPHLWIDSEDAKWTISGELLKETK